MLQMNDHLRSLHYPNWKIKNDLKANLVNVPLRRGRILDVIMETLKDSITALFVKDKLDLIAKSNAKKPLVICMIGINGSGKTTTIAKLVKYFQQAGKTCVLAASDTFRAAAIDQLQEHADKLGVTLIKHDYG